MFTCTGYTGTETLTDFQALIRLSENRYGFRYADCADSERGSDIWFSDAGGTVLPHEIDTWNTSGASDVWVKIPALTRGTKVVMHYGETRTTEQIAASSANVWEGFIGVWHMGGASGDEVERDATGNGLDATPDTNSTNAGDTSIMTADSDGIVGGSRVNTTSAAKGNALKVPDFSARITEFNTFSIGGWFHASFLQTGGALRFFCSRAATSKSSAVYNGWDITTADGSHPPSGVTATIYANNYMGRVTSGETSETVMTVDPVELDDGHFNRWMHLYVTFNRGNVKVYVDGREINSAMVGTNTVSDTGFWIGRFGNRASPFVGRYDELRMYDGVQSADRIKADYDTMTSPFTFFTAENPPVGRFIEFTCSGYSGMEALADFQALIRLSEGANGFSYHDCLDVRRGSDVWFVDAGGNVLPHEIDTWDMAGDSYIWVKVSALTRGAKIVMRYGLARTAEQIAASSANVWGGFVGVWHMGKATRSLPEPDASGNGMDAATSESSLSGYTGNTAAMVANADGMVGGSRVNTTSDKIGNSLKVPSYNGKLDDFNVFAVSGWFYQTAQNSSGVRRLFCSRAATTDKTNGAKVYNGWELTSPDPGAIPSGVTDTGSTYMDCYVARVTSGKTSSFTKFEAPTKAQNVVNRWVHYCVVFDGAAMKAYVDGALVNEGTITDELVAASGNGFWIGRFGNRANPFVGRYDEIRMYNGVQSADRVKADYDTASAPGAFFAVTGHGRFPKPGLMIIVK